MKKHEVFIGLNDRNTHTQILTYEDAVDWLKMFIESCTIIQVKGIYKGEEENSLQVLVYGKSKRELKELMKKCCDDFNQNEIIVDGESVYHD